MNDEVIDFKTTDMSRMFLKLPDNPGQQRRQLNRGKARARRWWHGERNHMARWFAAQAGTGSGQYTRNEGNLSGRRAYQRLQNARSLLWINDALGVDINKVVAAADAAQAEPDHRRRCGIVRSMLPWEDLVPLIKKRGLRAM
ncbi:hypothetical protein I6E29_08635 [Arcanobacterium haemolyticum]|nr:hypothetical protein [Arcanobacterium haemolyticum]